MQTKTARAKTNRTSFAIAHREENTAPEPSPSPSWQSTSPTIMPTAACASEITAYNLCVVISMLFTLALSIYARKQDRFADDPWIGMVIYYVCGAVKILIGALLLTVLYPADCVGFIVPYGALAIVIGLGWLYRGRALSNADSAQSDGDGGTGGLDLTNGLIHTAVLV